MTCRNQKLLCRKSKSPKSQRQIYACRRRKRLLLLLLGMPLQRVGPVAAAQALKPVRKQGHQVA